MANSDDPMQGKKEDLTSIWETFIQHNEVESRSASRDTSAGRFSDWSTASKGHLPSLHNENDEKISELNVIKPLGAGGMGEVYLAEQESIGRQVAIKVLRRDKRTDYHSNKLLHECRITGRLEHPNIIPVHSLGVDRHGFPLYVMKHVEGVSWKAAIKDPSILPESFRVEDDPIDAHLEIFERVCNAIHFAHEHDILHLDLKPSNVMLGEFGEVYVVDWGIAVSTREEDRGDLPLVDELLSPCGTPGYMAPEIASLQHHEIGPPADIYQLGAVLHYALLKKSRNQGKDMMDLLKNCVRGKPYDYPEHIPDGLARICNKATARRIQDRMPTVEALRVEVATFRKNREASNLITIAHQTMRDFESFMATAHDQESATSAIYELYGEIRFAIRRARMIDPDVLDAHALSIKSIRLMFDFEIERENLAAARALSRELAPLDDAQASKRQRALETLERTLHEREAQLEAFDRMKKDLDANLSRGKRALVIASLALAWGIIAAASRLLWTFEILPYTTASTIAVKTFNTLLGMGFIALAPKLMPLNRVNKQMLAILALSLLSGLFVRSAFLWNDLPVNLSLATETLAYLLCITAMAIFVTPRIFLGALFFIASIIGTLAVPEFAWEIMIGCNMTGLLAIGIIWGKSQEPAVAPKPNP